MKTETFDTTGKTTKPWPDFYSILDSQPEADAETLRQAINKMYVRANRESDHSELSKRFYYQVLGQKVLPECRRILLNKQTRDAYDEQWRKHRDGVPTALSYSEFILEITKNSNITSPSLLTDDELSILPAFHNEGGSVPVPVAVASSVPVSTSTTEKVSVRAANSVAHSIANPVVEPLSEDSFPSVATKTYNAGGKKNNMALWGGLAAAGVLLVGGGLFMYFNGNSEPETPPTQTIVRVPVPAAAPVVDTTLKEPLSLSFEAPIGTLSGDAKFGPGLEGQALLLNGTGKGSDELPQMVDTSKSYTVMAWVKVTSPDGYQTFVSCDGPHHSAFFLQIRGDIKRFSFATLSENEATPHYAAAKAPFKLNTWYHLAGVRDAQYNTLSLYVNGVLQQTVPFNQAYHANGPLRLGRAKFDGDSVDYVSGAIDNVQLTQNAMTGPQVWAAAQPFLKASAPKTAAQPAVPAKKPA